MRFLSYLCAVFFFVSTSADARKLLGSTPGTSIRAAQSFESMLNRLNEEHGTEAYGDVFAPAAESLSNARLKLSEHLNSAEYLKAKESADISAVSYQEKITQSLLRKLEAELSAAREIVLSEDNGTLAKKESSNSEPDDYLEQSDVDQLREKVQSLRKRLDDSDLSAFKGQRGSNEHLYYTSYSAGVNKLNSRINTLFKSELDDFEGEIRMMELQFDTTPQIGKAQAANSPKYESETGGPSPSPAAHAGMK